MVFCKRKESLFSGSLFTTNYYFVTATILSKYCMYQLWKRENTLNTEPINLGMGALDAKPPLSQIIRRSAIMAGNLDRVVVIPPTQ